MPDEFGGIEVQRDEFGGVAMYDATQENRNPAGPLVVSEPEQPIAPERRTTYGGPPKALASFAETGADVADFASEAFQRFSTPLVEAVPTLSPDVIAAAQGMSKADQIKLGVYNSLANTANFFTSPMGIATLGMGALPRVAQKVVAGAFAAQMASETPEIARQLGEELAKPEGERDTYRLSELITSGATSLGFTTLAGKHALTPGRIERINALAGAINRSRLEGVPAGEQFRAITEELKGPVSERPSMVTRADLLTQAAAQAEPVAPITAAALKQQIVTEKGVPNADQIESPMGLAGNAPTEPAAQMAARIPEEVQKPAEAQGEFKAEVAPAEPISPPAKQPWESLTDRLGVVERMLAGKVPKSERPLWEKERTAILQELYSIDKLPEGYTADEFGRVQEPTAKPPPIEPGEAPREAAPQAAVGESGTREVVTAASQPPAMAQGSPLAKVTQAGGNPYDTSATSARLTELQKTKPRPIAKLYGKNPTPEQVASQTAVIKKWNSEYRKAQKAHKETVAKSNAWIAEQKAQPPTPPPAAKGAVGARKATPEGAARVEEAKQRLRDVINNPDIVGKQRADMIANGKQLIAFLEANADTRKPIETDTFKGDQIAFTGVTTPEGYLEFIYLEGAKAGDYGVKPTTTQAPAAKGGGAPASKFIPSEFLKDKDFLVRERERILQDIDDWRTGKHATPGQPATGNNYQLVMRDNVRVLDERLAEVNKLLKEVEQQPPPPSTTEIVGMGGAVPKEFERGQGSPTAMKYRLIDQERRKRNLPELAKPDTVSDQMAMDRAMAAYDQDPLVGERLVKELNQKPRAIEDWENHVLLLRKIDLREAYEKSAREAMQAYEDAKQFPERLNDMNEANARTKDYSKMLSELEQASRVSGSARGRALRSLQVMANEDYSLASLEMQKRSANNWRELMPDERAELIKIAEDHKAKADAYEKKIVELEKAQADKDAQIALERAQRAAGKEKQPSDYILKIAERIGSKLHTEAEAARARLKAARSELLFGSGPIHELKNIRDFAIIGADHIYTVGLDMAKWSARMMSEFGPKIEPFLQQIFEASKKHIDDSVKVSAPRKVAEEVKAKVAKTEIDAIESTKEKIAKRLEKAKDADINFFIRRLGRLFVERGVKDRNELVDAVHAIVQDLKPDMTRRDTLDILAGYGDYTQLPKDTVSVIYRDLKGQLQQIAKLEDMAKGESPMRSGVERRSPSDEERRLQKQVEEAKRKGGYVQTDPQLQLRTALQEIQRRLENEIKDLDFQIERRQKIVREKTKVVLDAATERLKAIRDEKRALFNEIFKKPEITEAERLAKWKQRTIDRTAELQDFIEGKKQPKKRRDPVEKDPEALKLQFEKEIVERLWHEKLANDAWKQKRWFERLGYNLLDVTFNVPRALLTSGEFSAVLRQGKLVLAGHPLLAAKSLPTMFRAGFSEREAFNAAQRLVHEPNAAIKARAGLEYTEHGGKLNSMEEAFMSRLAPKIPVIGRFVRGSERAYVAFLNKLRSDYFDYLTKTLTVDGRGNPVELEHIANLVNVATGRGAKSTARFAGVLNGVFFSPRHALSRFQYTLGQPLRGGTARTKAIVLKEMARQFAGIAGVLTLAHLAGFHIGVNPNSSDFGKIIIGNTRIDVMAGLSQVIVLLDRLWSGKKTTLKGREVPIRRSNSIAKLPYGSDDASDLITRFIRQKLAPTPSMAINLLSGQDSMGVYFGPKEAVKQAVVPITYGDIYNVLQQQDMPESLIASLMAMFGEGVNTYREAK